MDAVGPDGKSVLIATLEIPILDRRQAEAVLSLLDNWANPGLKG